MFRRNGTNGATGVDSADVGTVEDSQREPMLGDVFNSPRWLVPSDAVVRVTLILAPTSRLLPNTS